MQTLKLLTITILLALTSMAQTYETKVDPKDRSQVVKFHLAMYLFDDFNQDQREYLLRAIENPSREMESSARYYFSEKDFQDIFLKIGTRDISAYRQIYATPILSEKKRTLLGLANAEKGQIWRDHFAYIISTEKLNREQIDFLIRVSDELRNPDLGRVAILGKESEKLFDARLGKALFATMGSYEEVGSLCKLSDRRSGPTTVVFADCPCNVGGSSWVCNSECQRTTSCVHQEDGCGFLWLYPCDGNCQTESND